MSAAVPAAFAVLAPRGDGLDVAAVFVASACERCASASEMAGDGVRAAGAVGPFRGDHRERDVRTRVVRIFGDRGSEGDRRAVLDGEQATHALGVRRGRTGQTPAQS